MGSEVSQQHNGGWGVLGPLSLLFICVWSLSRAACLGPSKWVLATQKVPLLHVPFSDQSQLISTQQTWLTDPTSFS